MCYTRIILESSLCSWSAHFWIDSTRSLIPCMNELQLSAARSASVWLSDWDLLVIDRKVVLSQDETSLAFGIAQGSFSAHQRWCFIRQEVAAIQNKWKPWGSAGAEEVASSGGNWGRKLILCLLCQRSLWFHVMTQHLFNSAPARE